MTRKKLINHLTSVVAESAPSFCLEVSHSMYVDEASSTPCCLHFPANCCITMSEVRTNFDSYQWQTDFNDSGTCNSTSA
ncbi:hypothetical protein EMCRGX_G005625 [Ephydatia muelleri]